MSAVCRPRFVRLTYTSFYFGSLVLMKGKKEKPSYLIQSVHLSRINRRFFILLHTKPQAFRHAKRGELVGGGTPWG